MPIKSQISNLLPANKYILQSANPQTPPPPLKIHNLQPSHCVPHAPHKRSMRLVLFHVEISICRARELDDEGVGESVLEYVVKVRLG